MLLDDLKYGKRRFLSLNFFHKSISIFFWTKTWRTGFIQRRNWWIRRRQPTHKRICLQIWLHQTTQNER